MVWFSSDFTDEPQYIRDIKHCYGQRPDSLEAALVQEWHWEEWKPTRFSARFLRPFVGLKTILHLMEEETLKFAEEPEAGCAAFVAILDKLKAEYLDFARNDGSSEGIQVHRPESVGVLTFSLSSLSFWNQE